MDIPLLAGIYSDATPDLRNAYPRNYVPVPKQSGVSQSYLKPAEGITAWGSGVPGIGRGGINWNDGNLYRVLGTKFCQVASDGTVTVLGDVGGTGQVSLDYGFDRIAIVSGGGLFYWTGSALLQVTDPDLGVPIDLKWIAGYYVTVDGTNIVVTDLNDPMSVNPLKYGSAEADPDKLYAVDELRNEMYALGRYTIEVFENVGGDLFPFQVNGGAMVPKGIVGTHAYCNIGDTFVFLGSGRNEALGVHMMVPGDTQKLSTREIDTILEGYTEAQLSQVVMEVRVVKNSQQVHLHLPDQCLVYDTIASKIMQEAIWHTRDSGGFDVATYRGRNFIWAYDSWTCEDPTAAAMGKLTDSVSSHYASAIGWQFGTPMVYNAGNDAIVLEMELVALPGRVPLGADPQVWTSHSYDGETWSIERALAVGKQGDRARRIAWRNCGRIRQYRMQKFRGFSDAHLPVARLEVKAEPLFTRPGANA